MQGDNNRSGRTWISQGARTSVCLLSIGARVFQMCANFKCARVFSNVRVASGRVQRRETPASPRGALVPQRTAAFLLPVRSPRVRSAMRPLPCALMGLRRKQITRTHPSSRAEKIMNTGIGHGRCSCARLRHCFCCFLTEFASVAA